MAEIVNCLLQDNMASNTTKHYSIEVIGNSSQVENPLVLAKSFMIFKIGKCTLRILMQIIYSLRKNDNDK